MHVCYFFAETENRSGIKERIYSKINQTSDRGKHQQRTFIKTVRDTVLITVLILPVASLYCLNCLLLSNMAFRASVLGIKYQEREREQTLKN